MADVLKKFGRYFLLDHIAQGGMAEIYRARTADAEGRDRILAIKRIISGYGADDEFKKMFKGEIQVTMQLTHPNVVQLYDYGEEQSQPFIVMELVDGKNLRQLLNRFNETKKPLPVELACYVIQEAAKGLHYAHTFKNKLTGEPLNIVHRDISPQNILVSFDGAVKVIDFGVAKASNQGEATRAGIIKGKPSYLAPEQISGEVLDGRCDVFALGIVIWELLVGRKLFTGENDLAVIRQIEACNNTVKAPSEHNGDVPKELDYIVLKALAKSRDKRYQSADELQRALGRFLMSTYPDFSVADLAQSVKELYQEEIVNDRKRIQALNEKVEQLLSHDIPETPGLALEEPSSSSQASDIGHPPSLASSGASVGAPSGAVKEERTSFVGARAKVAPGPTRSAPPAAQGKIELEASPHAKAGRPPTPAGLAPPRPGQSGLIQRPPLRAAPMPASARPQRSAPGALKPILALVAASLLAAVVGPQFGVRVPVLSDYFTGSPKTLRTPAEQKAKAPSAAKAAPQAAVGNAVKLILNLTAGEPGGTITLNGQPVDPANPIAMAPLDVALELQVDRPKFKPFTRQFVLSSVDLKGVKEYVMDVPIEPLRFGTLSIKSTPSAEAVIRATADGRAVAGDDTGSGQPWVLKTPIENQKLPPGRYAIQLKNVVLGMGKSFSILVEDGKAVNLDEKLELIK